MLTFNLLFKRKERLQEEAKEEIKPTELEKLCESDTEVLEALTETMFLYPNKITFSIEDALANAKKMEKEGDTLRAAIWYRIAGGLAIYKGDISKVKEYFDKYSKLTGKHLKILEIPEKVVKKAQEYYEKYLGKACG